MDGNNSKRVKMVRLQRRPGDCKDFFFDLQRGILRATGEKGSLDVVCYLHSKEGIRYKVSKDVLLQTGFMFKILQSVEVHGLIYGELALFFPEVESRLLKSVIGFLYHGVLEASFEDQNPLINILVKQFGFPPDMEFRTILFDTEEYDGLCSSGINAHYCVVCGKEDLKLDDFFQHVQDHVDDEVEKVRILIGEGRHVTCCFCKTANGINYRGQEDELQYVTDHFNRHLDDVTRTLRIKYCHNVKRRSKQNAKPLKKGERKESAVQNGLPKAQSQKPKPKSKKVKEIQAKSLSGSEPDPSSSGSQNATAATSNHQLTSFVGGSNGANSAEPELKLRCKSCSETVTTELVLRHVVSHNLDFWKNRWKRSSNQKLVCNFADTCNFSTSDKKEMVYHIAIGHDDVHKMCKERSLDVNHCFETVQGQSDNESGMSDYDDLSKYMEHVSDEETDVEDRSA